MGRLGRRWGGTVVALALVVALAGSGCGEGGVGPVRSDADAGVADAGDADGRDGYAGDVDGGAVDADAVDAGAVDADAVDADTLDAGAVDAGDGDGGANGAADAGRASLPLGVVATRAGAVRGEALEGGVWAFRGIPFAAPPVGERRWQPPAAAPAWEGVRDGTAFGAMCPQLDAGGAVVGVEDCLTLNVWTPAPGAPERRLPVLVFVHGGGNMQGGSAATTLGRTATYDGRRPAAAGAVVVTINYRLGPLGFLALPELSAAAPEGVSGNYGILDQLAALGWVRDNVAAFGGDPAQVLVFGESAGGADVCVLVASPLARGAFRAALVQSGGCTATPLAAAERGMAERVDGTVCGAAADRLACLRALPAEELVAALPGSVALGSLSFGSDPTRYGAVVDGVVLTDTPRGVIAAGGHNPVSFVIGSNREEEAESLRATVDTPEDYEARVRAAFGALGAVWTERILAAYPVEDYPTPRDALVALLSDARFTCPARGVARAAAASGGAPVRRYWFTRRATLPRGEKPAAHGVELLYVFGTLHDIPLYTPVEEDVALSEAMIGYWRRLAAAGDPNGDDAPDWPVYDAARDPVLVLDAPVRVEEGPRRSQCDLWDELSAALGG